MKKIMTFLLLCFFVMSANPQENTMIEKPNTYRNFFMNAQAGLSSTHWESKMDNKTGAALGLRLWAGFCLIEHLQIFGEFDYTSVFVQRFSIMDSGSDPTNLEIYGLGFGVNYYIMPKSFFISLSTIFPRSLYWFNQVKNSKSNSGIGITISLGKEWWKSEKFGLGLSIFFSTSKMNDVERMNNQEIKSNSLGLMFTITQYF